MTSKNKSLTAVTFVTAIVTIFAACNKQQVKDVGEQPQEKILSQPAMPAVNATVSYSETPVAPKYGIPGSTNYYFQVLDFSGINAISVKLYERATGTVTYIPMTRQGNYWVLSRQIATNGWFDYRYVFTSNNQNISSVAYELCNTKVVFTYSTNASVFSKLYWPFGADGSSYAYRNGWKSSMESGGCGNQWLQGDHTYQSCLADDTYAEDFNRDCPNSGGSSDDGAEVRAPLDGQVIFAGNSTGYGYRVDIQYVAPTGEKIVFRIAHLRSGSVPVAVNQWVRGGVTKIGNVGSTGNSTGPHAHIALYYVKTNGCYAPLVFKFNA